MTTDFLLTVRKAIGDEEHALAVKPAEDLARRRTLEKLEIERQYWTGRKIAWGIVTDREIRMDLVRNLEWIGPYRDPSALTPLTPTQIGRIRAAIENHLDSGKALSHIGLNVDDLLGLPSGTSLSVVRYLLANREWITDLSVPIDPSQPIRLIAKNRQHEGAGAS